MLSFGKKPHRSLDSFGVSGLLEEDCEILYSTLFNPKHVGRISDLLSASLKDLDLDELKLRAIILYASFEAFIASSGDPVLVECGFDSEKIAIGVSFGHVGTIDSPSDLMERIRSGAPADDFERLLAYLHAHANRVVIRQQLGKARLEVVSILGIPSKMDAEELASKGDIEVITVEDSAPEAPKAKSYTELGDLNYSKLLGDEVVGAEPEPTPADEILARTVRDRSAALEATRIHGDGQKPSEATTIKGTTEHMGEGVFQVKGQSAQDSEGQNRMMNWLGSGQEPGSADEPASQAVIQSYIDKISELERKIEELESAKPGSSDASYASDSEDKEISLIEEGVDGLKTLVKKIWPFKRQEEDEPETEVKPEETQADASEGTAPEGQGTGDEPLGVAPEKEPAAESEKSADEAAAGASAEAGSTNLLAEIQGGKLEKVIHRAKQEAAELKADVSPKARRWVEKFMGEILAEKVRLQEMARKVNAAIRQKELEFKNREQRLQSEIRRRDDLIRQKNFAITRVKDQMTQTNIALEKLKGMNRSLAEDAHYKQKYNNVQKLLLMAKEENKALTAKFEEQKTRMNTEAVAKSRVVGPDLKARLERTQRQLEEMKKTNQQLLERIEQAKKSQASSEGGSEDLKHRLQTAMKMVVVHKNESEQLSRRLADARKQEARLKQELAMAKKALLAKGSGGKPGAAA